MNGKRGFIVQRNTQNKEALVDSDDKKLTTVYMTEKPTKISITIETVGGRFAILRIFAILLFCGFFP